MGFQFQTNAPAQSGASKSISLRPQAGDNLTAEKDAAQALIDYWNKQDTAPEGTEAELRALLDTRALELEETSVVMDALPDAQAETAAGCDIEAADCVHEEEVVVVAE